MTVGFLKSSSKISRNAIRPFFRRIEFLEIRQAFPEIVVSCFHVFSKRELSSRPIPTRMKVYRDSKCEFGWVLVHRYCWKSPYDQYRMFRNYCFAKNTNIFACPRVRHRTLFTYDCCACARHKWREKRQTTFEKTPNCNNGVVSRELYWAARWK